MNLAWLGRPQAEPQDHAKILGALHENQPAFISVGIDDLIYSAKCFVGTGRDGARTLRLYWSATEVCLVFDAAPRAVFKLGSHPHQGKLNLLREAGYDLVDEAPRPKGWVRGLLGDLGDIRRGTVFCLIFVVLSFSNAFPLMIEALPQVRIYPVVQDQLALIFMIAALYLTVFGLFSAATQRESRKREPDALDFSNLDADKVLLSWVLVALASATLAFALSVMAGEWSPCAQAYLVIALLSFSASCIAMPLSDVVPFIVNRERMIMMYAKLSANRSAGAALPDPANEPGPGQE